MYLQDISTKDLIQELETRDRVVSKDVGGYHDHLVTIGNPTLLHKEYYRSPVKVLLTNLDSTDR